MVPIRVFLKTSVQLNRCTGDEEVVTVATLAQVGSENDLWIREGEKDGERVNIRSRTSTMEPRGRTTEMDPKEVGVGRKNGDDEDERSNREDGDERKRTYAPSVLNGEGRRPTWFLKIGLLLRMFTEEPKRDSNEICVKENVQSKQRADANRNRLVGTG